MNVTNIDATNQSFGRLASQVAKILIGKTRPTYQPHIMPKEQVVVENIDKIKFTGNKFTSKKYYRYSGYHGGITKEILDEKWSKNSRKVLTKTIFDMLPKNKLRSEIIKNLIIK
ncbi:MAG: 50S ribosomal protein L13 [Candidatus Yanofskybacteria bacterium CG10_big_fil_rev_8_21_14_0_10_46_23]|uniref:50S ribosomal protein L13 n=1 Tax=Candidatus Yanofskybacteria bacterium CG10_big_fil_rev_8_21_14_0_10_46_23 TaxID=1975098 RepID=A0A2H0R4P6_9BACT|nr:MAG: 50S ribosomal protein L13 [Candidatus Yanofskybacteria bacterium CG10_big_fil_rev_8_21_14_0_10_46_23]